MDLFTQDITRRGNSFAPYGLHWEHIVISKPIFKEAIFVSRICDFISPVLSSKLKLVSTWVYLGIPRASRTSFLW